MITRIRPWAYKCLASVDVQVNRFNVLVGPNASGKSTLLDVIGFLHDALAAKGDVTAAVRERAEDVSELIWRREKDRFELAIEVELPPELQVDEKGQRRWERLLYVVCIGTGRKEALQVLEERAFAVEPGAGFLGEVSQPMLFPEFPDRRPLLEDRSALPPGYEPLLRRTQEGASQFWAMGGGHWPYRAAEEELALSAVPGDPERFGKLLWLRDLLMRRTHFVQLNPVAMRKRCPAAASRDFQSDGSNLPALVARLSRDHPKRFRWWVEHLRTVLPDLTDVQVRRWPEDRSMYLVLTFANGLKVRSWQLSDGTLRLLALTLIAYLPPEPRIFIIEEPENGIHPTAIEAVVQSLQSTYQGQVFIATHSPIVVGLCRPKDLLCFSLNEQGATQIVRGDRHERLQEWLRDLSLGDIFAAGILS